MSIFASLALLGCGRIGVHAQGDGGNNEVPEDGDIDAPDGGPPPGPLALAVGDSFACAVRGGGVWCWGEASEGQLGDNSTTPKALPVRVSGITDAVTVVAGELHACVLRETGRVLCWGQNEYGQVGTTDSDSQLVPVAVPGLGEATAVAAGGHHSCAVMKDKTAWCWGDNTKGQLGNDGPSTPVPQKLLDDVTLIAGGHEHTCVLRGDGSAWCVGYNGRGQLGDGTDITRSVVMPVPDLTATVLAAGGDTTCAIVEGRYRCWGSNDNGQHGTDDYDQRSTPAPASTLDQITAIYTGGEHTCAVRDGNVICWGDGTEGELGYGTREGSPTPVNTLSDGHAIAVSTGADLSCALRDNGTVACWGLGSSGQLGNGSSASWEPQKVVDLVSPIAVATGSFHSCAIADPDRSVYCWGADWDAQLGDRAGAPQPRPVFANLTGATQLSLGFNHSCALRTDDTVWCWGDGSEGQLGNGTFDHDSRPVQAQMPTGTPAITAIAAGDHFTCAMHASGALCWGYNRDGQLGDGGANEGMSKFLPQPVPGVTSPTMIAAGGEHACAGSASGLKCWGEDECGQIGNGDVDNEPQTTTPVDVAGAGTMWMPSKLSAGAQHTCAVDANGRLRCWGRNGSGELGDGTFMDRTSPQAVIDLTTTRVVDIDAGEDFTCAQTTGGPRCWGLNRFGTVGDGSNTNRVAPVAVKSLATSARPSAGGTHACAIVGGEVSCWGDNSDGQLGTGTFSLSLVPVDVQFPPP